MSVIRDVVFSQKQELEQALQRPYFQRCLPHHTLDESDLIRVVLGPRRAGKSTLSIQLLKHFGGGGYLNFDDERLAGFTDADPLIASLDEIYGHPKFILFDEIQNFPRWELLANRLQRSGRRLLLTGSNANLLGSELATHLTGRHQAIILLPFSFAEILSAEKREMAGAERAARLDRYLLEGGYPEPLLRGASRTDYLRDLVRSTLLKDIVRRYRIRASGGLEDVAHHFFSNIGKEFSFRTVASLARVTSPVTAEKYTRMLEESFLMFSLHRFSFKSRERSSSNKKAYVIDPALAVCLGTRPGEDSGRLLENVVATVLRQKQLAGGIELAFWKNQEQEEVDFVVQEKGRVSQLLQVCWDLHDPRTRTREFRALAKAGAELRCENLCCLTRGEERQEDFTWHGQTSRIRILSAERWLAEV